MRDIGLFAFILATLPLAAARPFVGVLLWCWISFLNPHKLGWGFANELPLATMAFAVTVVGCVLAREPRQLPLNAVTVLLVVLAGLATLTSVTALGPPELVWSKWEELLKITLGLLLTAALLTDRRRIHALLWLIVISLGYFGVRGGLFTLLTGGQHIVLGPPLTSIADRNHLAVGLLVAVPLMNYLRLQSPHRLVRWGLAAAMVLTLFSVVGTQSRGALVALAATAVVLWLRSRGKILSGLAIVGAVAGAITFMPDSWTERMRTIATYQQDDSAMGRVMMWKAAADIAMERPLVGGGFRATYLPEVVARVAPGVDPRAAHSIWFDVLGEHGFLGFFIWLGILLAAAFYTVRMAALARGRPDLEWARDLARMAQVSMVAYAAGGSFVSLAYWDIFWTLLIVIAAAHALVLAAVRRESAGVARAGRTARLQPAAAPG